MRTLLSVVVASFILCSCVVDDADGKTVELADATWLPNQPAASSCAVLLAHVSTASAPGVSHVLVQWNDGWSYASDDIQRVNADLVSVRGPQTYAGAIGVVQYRVALESGALVTECRWREQVLLSCAATGCNAGGADDPACFATGEPCTCDGLQCQP